MLDDRQLADARSTAEASLDTTVDILIPNEVGDARGGLVRGFKISDAKVPARIAERTGRERVFAGHEDVKADYVLTLRYSQAVDEGMRIDHFGQIYLIAFVNTDRSYGTARRCLINRQ